jgi:hypothetical protein
MTTPLPSLSNTHDDFFKTLFAAQEDQTVFVLTTLQKIHYPHLALQRKTRPAGWRKDHGFPMHEVNVMQPKQQWCSCFGEALLGKPVDVWIHWGYGGGKKRFAVLVTSREAKKLPA